MAQFYRLSNVNALITQSRKLIKPPSNPIIILTIITISPKKKSFSKTFVPTVLNTPLILLIIFLLLSIFLKGTSIEPLGKLQKSTNNLSVFTKKEDSVLILFRNEVKPKYKINLYHQAWGREQPRQWNRNRI
jgi:TRAP-type C4-dicarboxylate transport system permease large subunit